MPQGSHRQLWNVIPHARLATFAAHTRGSADKALDLYMWDRDLSAAIFADIAILEVALRSSLHNAASEAWGQSWYLSIDMDSRHLRQIKDAWSRLPRAIKDDPHRSDVPGRLVANCMFGFWVNLLDEGGYVGEVPRRRKVDYNQLWPVFKRAFPGGGPEAREIRTRRSASTGHPVHEPGFSREWTHSVCKTVNDLRNRIAHHEPLVNGFPLKGQNQRLTAAQGYEECLRLARMIDAGFGDWFARQSKVPHVLARDPRATF